MRHLLLPLALSFLSLPSGLSGSRSVSVPPCLGGSVSLPPRLSGSIPVSVPPGLGGSVSAPPGLSGSLSPRLRGQDGVTLKVDGTEAITNMVRSAMEFLQFQKIHIRGEGARKVAKADKKSVEFHVEYDTARVDGSFDDEPYEFDFERKTPPEGLDKDKLKQICWFFSMGGPQFIVDPKGSYKSTDPNKDAWGEAMDLVANGVVRLSDKPVKAGEEWTSDWKGQYKQKDNDGRFNFTQKSKIEKIEEKDGRKLAHISHVLTGTLDIPEAKRDKNAEKQETKLEAKGTLVLDVESGAIVSSTAKGTVIAEYKGLDPNTGDSHELKIQFGVESKFE